MAECSPHCEKTLWEKEKLLITTKFSFSLRVFIRLVLQTQKHKGMFGKQLNDHFYRPVYKTVGKLCLQDKQHCLPTPLNKGSMLIELYGLFKKHSF